MKLKTRIEKLEKIIENDSDFCNCEKETVFKIVPFGADDGTTETTICETCRKPLPETLRATFSFGNNIEVSI